MPTGESSLAPPSQRIPLAQGILRAMATTGDPWRILGLAPGASADEVRRAYRKLAKANHPDAAGEAALPRFLAIQAAYEQLAGPGRPRRPGARPGASGSPPPASPREPWRADPDRARASGRADGRRPGARPAGRSGGGSANPDEPGRTGGGTGAAEPGARSSRPGSAGRARRPSSRRPSKTATPYSTSYDAADEEPFEPGWSGGTWYGASSGTYWTINPKEYADPRKHGPEYQARARRAAGSAADPAASEPGVDAAAAEPRGATDGAGQDPSPDERRRAESSDEPAEANTAARAAGAPDAARPHRTAWTAAAGASPAMGAWSRSPGEQSFGAGPADGAEPPPSTRAGDAARFRGPMLPRATTPTGRLAIALLGWPPLALFVAAAIGESTGCGRYAASCSELSSPGTWIVALAILLLLLALPAVATWSAHGSIAALVIGVPSAVVLSAAGGTNLPGASAPLMLAVLAVAYLAGLAYGLVVPRLSPPA
jgi:Meckel syndrome type 1 protein